MSTILVPFPYDSRAESERRAQKGIKHSFWYWFGMIFFFPFVLMWWILKFTFLACFWFISIPLYTARHRRAKKYKQAKQAAQGANNHREVTVSISKEDLDKLKNAVK